MNRILMSLGFGLILAIGSIFFLNDYIGDVRKEAQRHAANLMPKSGIGEAGPQIEMASVVVSNRDLPFGSVIHKDHLKEIEWPAETVPDGAFSSIDEIYEGADGERHAIKAIYKNEPLYQRKVSGFGERATMSGKLADDMRAFSIRINDVSGVAGFLLPGDRVDIMLTRKEKDAGLVSDLILQNVVILGIDQLADEERNKPVVARTATVEVTPQQAQKLAVAQQAGTLSLTLRNVNAASNVRTQRVTAEDLSMNSVDNLSFGPTVKVRRGVGPLKTEKVIEKESDQKYPGL